MEQGRKLKDKIAICQNKRDLGKSRYHFLGREDGEIEIYFGIAKDEVLDIKKSIEYIWIQRKFWTEDVNVFIIT